MGHLKFSYFLETGSLYFRNGDAEWHLVVQETAKALSLATRWVCL